MESKINYKCNCVYYCVTRLDLFNCICVDLTLTSKFLQVPCNSRRNNTHISSCLQPPLSVGRSEKSLTPLVGIASRGASLLAGKQRITFSLRRCQPQLSLSAPFASPHVRCRGVASSPGKVLLWAPLRGSAIAGRSARGGLPPLACAGGLPHLAASGAE
jgi:hypothetical protein